MEADRLLILPRRCLSLTGYSWHSFTLQSFPCQVACFDASATVCSGTEPIPLQPEQRAVGRFTPHEGDGRCVPRPSGKMAGGVRVTISPTNILLLSGTRAFILEFPNPSPCAHLSLSWVKGPGFHPGGVRATAVGGGTSFLPPAGRDSDAPLPRQMPSPTALSH